MKITLELTPKLQVKIKTEGSLTAPIAIGMLEYAVMVVKADIVTGIHEQSKKTKNKSKEPDHA